MSAKKPASSLSPGSIPPPIESDFGRLDAPGVRFGENCAGAGDPGQFLAAAWERYGVDGDGVKGRYDAGDAIPAPANLLHQHGAPGDYGRAIFAYNHAGSYVEEVLSRAARGAARPDATAAHAVPVAHIGPTAACTDDAARGPVNHDAARGPVNLASAVRLTSPAAYRQLPAWAMAGGRPLEPVDARIHDDVLWALRRYGLRVSAAREPRHRTHGDGTAVDLVPAVGATRPTGTRAPGASPAAWAGPRAAARRARARRARSGPRSSGSATTATETGLPRTCTGTCPTHIRVSWVSGCYGSSALVTPCAWVVAFPAPPEDGAT